MADTTSSLTIQISDTGVITAGSKEYNLEKSPPFNDPLVQKQVKSVLGNLSLHQVTENLDLSVELFFVAYNGAAGAEGGTIQAEISKMQSQLAEMCNQCVITMTSFQENTEQIMSEINRTYRWLTGGDEKLAVKTIQRCSSFSSDMSSKAGDLAHKFEALQTQSAATKAKTIVAETKAYNLKEQAEKAERDIKAKQTAETVNQKNLVSQITQMQTLYNDAKQREEEASKNAMITGIVSAIAGAIGSGLGAYAATKNPMGAMMNQQNSNSEESGSSEESKSENSEDNEKVSQQQEKVKAAQEKSTEAETALTTAKHEQETDQQKVDQLTNELKVAQEAGDSTEEKQSELDTANEKLDTAKTKVDTLTKPAHDATAAYQAAAAALKSISESTGQMSKAATTAEQSISKEKMTYLNNMLKLEQENRESLVQLAEYAASLKNEKVEESQAKISENSLNAAIGALGKIVSTLTNASLFWEQMAQYCDNMSKSQIQQDIEDISDPANEFSKEYRINFYKTDSVFVPEFLTYLCQWVALNGICSDYLTDAQKAQEKATAALRENPSIEEALKKAPQLAAQLEEHVDTILTESIAKTVALKQQQAAVKAISSAS